MAAGWIGSEAAVAVLPEPKTLLADEPNPQLLADKWVRGRLARRDDDRANRRNDSAHRRYTFKETRQENLEAVRGVVARAMERLPAVIERLHAHPPSPRAAWTGRPPDREVRTLVMVRPTREPLALHLSRPNVLENASVCLHRMWGVPYLPGSGLKGAARAAALHRLADAFPGLLEGPGGKGGVTQVRWRPEAVDASKRDEARRAMLTYAAVYGVAADDTLAPFLREALPGETAPEQWAGGAVFWDALPEGSARIEIDVVTVHQPSWYQKPDAMPSEQENPVPNQFPVVRGDFRFCVSRRRAGGLVEALTKVDPLEQAMRDLDAALEDWGVGAKTAAGYGRFGDRRPPESADPPDELDEADERALADFKTLLDAGLPTFAGKKAQELSDAQDQLAKRLRDLRAAHPAAWRCAVELVDAKVGKKSRRLRKALNRDG